MDRNATLIACALIVAATWLVNLPTLDYDFVYDDQALILEREPVWEEGLSTALVTRHWGAARKVALVSLDLDRRTPLVARPFHITNLVLATLCALLVFALGRSLSLTVAGAAAAGILFTLHPIHTDAVVSIVGRAELLAAAGLLAALVLHIRDYPGGLGSRALAATAFALAMLSKESAACLPGLILLYDLVLARRRLARSLYTLAPYLAVLAAWAALALAQTGELAAIAAVDNPLAHTAAPWRMAMGAEILGRYLALTLAPIGLLPERSYATVDPGPALAVVAALAWLVALVLVWRQRERHPLPVFLLLWFPLAFGVTANVVFAIGTNMAERLAFLPSVGPCLLAGLALGHMYQHGGRSAALAALALVVAAACLVPTYRWRAAVWTANEHYHRRAVELSPDSAKGWYNLAMVHVRAKRERLALRSFTRAAEIMPDFDMAVWWRATLLISTNRSAEAETVYRDYLRLRPDDAGMGSHLVTLLAKEDRTAEALPFARRMVEAEPDDPKYTETLRLIERALAGTPPVSP